jgi:hypothetical protein
MVSNELEYCLKRAREEARRALRADQPEVASVHQRLSVRYSARAFMLRAGDHGSEPLLMERPALRA